MIDVNQLRRGVTFEHEGNLYKVTEYSHHKPGRGKATIRVGVRDMRSGANLQLTFSSGDRVDDVRTEKRPMQYLFDEDPFYVFMDQETFEQKRVRHEVLGEDAKYLKDNLELELVLYGREVIDYNLPPNVDLEVVKSEMAVAGDTATGATKDVVTETGLTVRTPLFVEVGDLIRVDTRSGEYVTRV